MTYADLPCQDFVELATEYLEGTLDAGPRLSVELHLAFCSPCVDYLDQMRATLDATRRLREDHVPEAVVDALVEVFRARDQDD